MEGKILVIFMTHHNIKNNPGWRGRAFKDKIGMVSQNKRALYQERSDKNGKPQ